MFVKVQFVLFAIAVSRAVPIFPVPSTASDPAEPFPFVCFASINDDPFRLPKTENPHRRAMWVLVDAELYLSFKRLPCNHTIAHTPEAGSAGWKSARTFQ
jgi:hypothetical protein